MNNFWGCLKRSRFLKSMNNYANVEVMIAFKIKMNAIFGNYCFALTSLINNYNYASVENLLLYKLMSQH